MNILESILDRYPEDSFKTADGFNDAIIGLEEKSMRIIYSTKKCIDILMERDGMDREGAQEYFDFNVLQAYVGEDTPIWCEDDYI